MVHMVGRQYSAHTVYVQYINASVSITGRDGVSIWTSFDASITETNSCSTASELQIQVVAWHAACMMHVWYIIL